MNWFDFSGSAMFCYALAKGTALGLLPVKPFLDLARASFGALVDRYVEIAADGTASLGGICKVAGLGGEPYRDGSYAYYIGEPIVADDFKGVGPLILAALELGKAEVN